VLNITPNGNEGGIWMSGGGPAADSQGNIYLLDGNGTFDTTLDANGFPSLGDFGNGFLKLSTQSGALAVADYFETVDQGENDTDQDLGSGGTVVLPDLTDASGKVWHLAVGAGKDANLYLVTRDAMGKFNPVADAVFQEISQLFPGPDSLHPHTLTAPSTMVRSATRSRPSHSTTRTSRPPRPATPPQYCFILRLRRAFLRTARTMRSCGR